MSFYLDNDEVQFSQGASLPSSFQAKEESSAKQFVTRADDAFVCDNCGGDQSYLDETTGGLICASCFTQSQTILAASQEEVDYDEVMALAGRFSGGHLASASTPSTRRRKVRAPLRDIDSTSALPKTDDCIFGMQRLLRESTRIVAKIIQCDSNELKSALDTTRTIWRAYLWSWMQGAIFFGRQYPEVRLCFRDSFVNASTRARIIRTLAHKATRHLRGKQLHWDRNQPSRKGTIRATEGRDLPGSVNSDTADCISTSSALTLKGGIFKKFGNAESVNSISRMLSHHFKIVKKRTIGRKVAALSLQPSLTMIAAILAIAFRPLGVTAVDIRMWIADGKLPLLNAYWLLTPRERQRLCPIQGFFRLYQPPSIHNLLGIVARLKVACGYQPKHGISDRPRKQRLTATSPAWDFEQGSHVEPTSIPLALARLVSRLGLSQIVMDYTLALMGISIADKRGVPSPYLEKFRGLWIPRALRCCRGDRPATVASLLGTIAFACKLIPDWRSHWFSPACLSHSRFLRKPSLLVWNEPQARWSRTASLGPYLDVLEGDILEPTESVLTKFVTVLKQFSCPANHSLCLSTDDTVCPHFLRIYQEQGPPGKKQHFVQMHPIENGRTARFPHCTELVPLVDFMAQEIGVSQSKILEFMVILEGEVSARDHKRVAGYIKCSLEEACGSISES